MQRAHLERLDPGHVYWVAAVAAPCRNWAGAPGCRRGARFLVDPRTFHASREAFEPFDSQLACLQWIMRHRAELNAALPGTRVSVVQLDRWLLGLS